MRAENLQQMLSDSATNTNSEAKFFSLSGDLNIQHQLSHNELETKAKQIASHLQAKGIKKGDRIILIYSSGIEFICSFFGCIYAGAIAVPCHPPANKQLMLKLASIIRNAQPKMMLSESHINDKLQKLRLLNKARKIKIVSRIMDAFQSNEIPYASELDTLDYLSTDTLNKHHSLPYQPIHVENDDIVFLQYTSGSTGDPKGVMITHQNLIDNISTIQNNVNITEDDKVISWLPPYHDMGLIGGMLVPLYQGIPVYIISPIDFLRHPYSWLSAISKFSGTLSPAPNFAYALCHRKISDEQVQTLNLASWRAALNGAEPISPKTLRLFVEKFSACGFKQQAVYPCYGMAESTLFICGRYGINEAHISKNDLLNHKITPTTEGDDKHVLISCGKAPDDLLIVQPESNHSIDNAIGEICITGRSVTHGYWNHEKGNENFFTLEKNGKACSYFKTGDLGFIHEGELYITGRKKDLIIIHGSNHYPQDIEETIYQVSPQIHRGSSAAFSLKVDDEERLSVIVGVESNVDTTALISQIKHHIGQAHNLSVYSVTIVHYKQIHKTTSGKIQRYKNKMALLANEFEIIDQDVKPISDTEINSGTSSLNSNTKIDLRQAMRRELATVLSIDTTMIEDDKPFTDYGLDSLMVIELENKLEDHLHGSYQFSPNDVYDYPTIAKLSKHIESVAKK